ncbi:MAG: type II secretion system F family protein [Thermacetogeniaceae bacterium]
MPQSQSFSYKARNLSGQIITGNVQANSTSAVITLLRSRNLFVVNINQQWSLPTIDLDKLFKRKIGARSLAIFCRQFATMNQAGIPILQCLHILARQTEGVRLQKILESVAKEIEQGTGLSDAFRRYREQFPDIFVSMLAAGELSGTLDQCMERLAVTFEREHALQSKIKSAMTYPMLIGIMALVAVIALLIFVVPIFVDIFKQAGATLPLPTQIMLTLSNVLIHYWFIILPLLFIVLPVGISQLLASKQGRRAFDRIILKLPIVGSMTRKTAVARFARTLSTLLKSGIPLLRALETVEEIVGNTVAADNIAEARSNIKEGDRMSPILARSNFFPPMAVSMISIGEESGSLDTLLDKLAIFYEDEVEAMVASLSSTIEPLMIAGVGLIIGFIAISIYMPLFGLSGAMSAGSGVPTP